MAEQVFLPREQPPFPRAAGRICLVGMDAIIHAQYG
jgi:hypothetical protein